VICELLDVPYPDRADFQRRSAVPLDATVPRHEQFALGRLITWSPVTRWDGNSLDRVIDRIPE
jgi:hypothetical protein